MGSTTMARKRNGIICNLKGKMAMKLITPAAIAALPKDLLVSLRDAVVQGDLEAIAIAIKQVRMQNEELGNALFTMALRKY